MERTEIEAIVRRVLQAVGSVSDAGIAGNTGNHCHSWTDICKTEAGTETKRGILTSGPAKAAGGLVQPTISLAAAVKLIEKIEARAAEWNMRVVTAVSDASARPVAVHCMDGAYIGSFDVALNKTYTSIAFQMSTAQLGALSQPGESLYGIQFTNEGKIVIFGGGELLIRNGVIVGALGVSGGSAEQDTKLAAYGKSVFESY